MFISTVMISTYHIVVARPKIVEWANEQMNEW